jgi:predicted choloylglycine hydrolase
MDATDGTAAEEGCVDSGTPDGWPLTFTALAEPLPGPGWQGAFSSAWPGYRRWYLRDGMSARTGLDTCAGMLARHMPELVPTWERLVELAGGDPLAAQMLTLYNPPAYLTGCSQAVHLAEPALVRNYDYAPELLERVVLGTAFTGRRVVGMSDCLWGLVDGMNDAGLAVSLAFGGQITLGPGFGIPLVLRYVLEVCGSAAEARDTLARLPVHMAYNVTVADRAGDYFTAYLGPDRVPHFTADPVATNTEPPAGPGPVSAPHSQHRRDVLAGLVYDEAVDLEGLVAAFLEPPLYASHHEHGFGTLYTAVYRPADLTLEYRWPGSSWRHSIGSFSSGRHQVVLSGSPCPQP